MINVYTTTGNYLITGQPFRFTGNIDASNTAYEAVLATSGRPHGVVTVDAGDSALAPGAAELIACTIPVYVAISGTVSGDSELTVSGGMFAVRQDGQTLAGMALKDDIGGLVIACLYVDDGPAVIREMKLAAIFNGITSTGNATPVNVITLPYSLPVDTMVTIETVLSAKKSDMSACSSWKILSTWKNVGGTVSQEGGDIVTQSGAAWPGGMPQTVNPTGAQLNLQVTGVAATTYTHAARMTINEN